MKNYGACFKQAFESLKFHPKAMLVHAIITNPSGKKIAHGWVEFVNFVSQEFVYDASVNETYTKDYFYNGYKPTQIHKYTPDMALILAEESGLYGPWDTGLIKFMGNVPIRNATAHSKMWRQGILKGKKK